MNIRLNPKMTPVHPRFLARLLMLATDAGDAPSIKAIGAYAKKVGYRIDHEMTGGDVSEIVDAEGARDLTVRVEYALCVGGVALAHWKEDYHGHADAAGKVELSVSDDDMPLTVFRISDALGIWPDLPYWMV